MNIGEYIKEDRLNKGMTVREYGKVCGLTGACINLIELGKVKRPQVETLYCLSKITNLSVIELCQLWGIGDNVVAKKIAIKNKNDNIDETKKDNIDEIKKELVRLLLKYGIKNINILTVMEYIDYMKSKVNIKDLSRITCWYRLKEGEYKYNHFENGWVRNAKPKPKVAGSVQENWCKSKWKKEHTYLIDNVIIKVD